MRAVVGRPTTLTVILADAQGDPAQADPATTVTVDVADGTGTLVVNGAATVDDAPRGQYSYVLAPRADLDTFTVTWHATISGYPVTVTDTLRLVGSRILSPADLANDSLLAALTPPVRAEVLDGVEDLFADALGYPVVLEGARVNFDAHRGTFAESYVYGAVQQSVLSAIPGLGFGFGGERLPIPGVAMPQQVFTLSINGNVAASDVLAQIRPGFGFLVWQGGRSWPSGNYDMWLSHGLPFVPGDLRDAAAIYARYKARRASVVGQNSLLPERTASLTTEGGTIVFSMASPERPTGIPDVDAVLQRYRVQSVI